MIIKSKKENEKVDMNNIEFIQEALRLYEKYPTRYQLGTFFNKKTSDGQWLCDCTGLIKAILYGYPEQGVYKKNDIPDQNDIMMFNESIEKGTIKSIPEIPGLIVWQKGHVGIYLGNGKVLESTQKVFSSGEGNGLVLSQFVDPKGKNYRGTWTHWFKYRYIDYGMKEEKMKDNYQKINYNGLTIHVAILGKQENREYRGSIVGKKGIAQRSIYMDDSTLEKEGWKSGAHTNGTIFYPYQGVIYSEGILKVCGVVYQDWDSEFDELPCIAFDYSGNMIIDTQKNIKVDMHKYYSVMTSCFGVLKNGVAYDRPSKHTSQYDCISGRTLIGHNENNQIVMASFAGVTGKNGLKGSQLPALAKHLGMVDCVCMDGGGSVYFSSNGSIKINTTRAVYVDIILYYKEKDFPKVEEPEVDSETSGTLIYTGDKKLNIRNQPVSGKIITTVPSDEYIEILDFLDGLKADGYQWAKVKWKDTIGYSQIDTAYTTLKEKKEIK